ncbi:hypothetical protein [Burkholderia vietnamiensis]|uniref:hypothetical protein n=1 Tax=Burkholderia vietnamiensis TaxID=60552 RepID=UPI0018DD486A|nr:hypothetical protein [Burkholderia vietnamiensis]MBH9645037.1 hypothetical protein [Burkholderia vietnamiensis]
MKKILFAALFAPLMALAQTYPSPTFSGLTLQNPLTVANGGTGSTAATGSGAVVLATSPTLTSPNLGTPSAVTLTNGSGLPISGIAGLGTGVSAALGSAVTGSGGAVLATSPSIASPSLTGVPTAPTAATGTNTTQISTTAFVANGKPCPSILDHGGDPTDTNDNGTALTNTIAASPSGQVCVFFPAGTYKFTSANSYSFPGGGSGTSSITFQGAGAEVTKLDVQANTTAFSFNYASQSNSTHIRDLTIMTNQPGNSAIGVYLNQTNASVTNPAVEPASDISHVIFRGNDGFGVTNYWSTAVTISGVGNVNFDGSYFFGSSTKLGTGVNLFGTASAIPVVFNFHSSAFVDMQTGIVYGTYVQGVTVSQSNFTHVQNGIVSNASESGLDQLTVSNSQFEASSNGILESTGIAGTIISNNLFIVDDGANGVNLSGCANCQIVGNAFASGGGTPNDGISITGAALPTVVTGNTFQSMTNGVFMNASGHGVTVIGNGYKSNSTNVGNLGGTACPATDAGNCIGTATP